MAMQCRLQWRTTAFVRRGCVAPREVAYVRRGHVSPRGEGVCAPGDVCHPEDEASSGARRDGVDHRQRGSAVRRGSSSADVPASERAQLGRAERHGQLVAEASTTNRAASSGTPCQD